METKQVIDTLNRARRALDSLSQVKMIDDWQLDEELNVWFLHLSISIEHETKLFPQTSNWYIVVQQSYPKGKIKVYPDVRNSIEVTLYHQSNNSTVEKNGLWRKGALCLEVNTISSNQQEPYSIDERLLYHVKRAVYWLEAVSKGTLVSKNEPFELPDLTLTNICDMQFAFSEDEVTYMQWESTDCRYGIAELDIYKSKPFIYYIKTFKSLQHNTEHYTQWGKYLSQKTISPSIKAPWILLDRIPVLNEWQAPETFGDLIDVCSKQHIDLLNILQSIFSQIRDGKRHLLLIGFPIPKVFEGELKIVFWQALYLPVLSHGRKAANGFRPNQKGWWMRDKCEILTKNTKLEWIISENWNQREISQRGKMNDLLQRKSILLIGTGCIGASIAEILVRAGIYNLTIADSDVFGIGNLSRHTLNINNLGEIKEASLCNHLNMLNPHAIVDAVNKKLIIDDNFKPNLDLDKFDIIIDCTGANSVLENLEHVVLNKKHLFVSVSVGLGAKRLYITMMKGNTFNFGTFYELIFPYLQEEQTLYDDYELPRNGVGCWHPTFPGRSDDIWLAASTSVKIIENYFLSKSEKTLSFIYEQKINNGFYEGYVVVNKKENG